MPRRRRPARKNERRRVAHVGGVWPLWCVLKLSKQRRVYALFLGLGLTALVVDKVLLPPAGAGAATPDASPAAAPAPQHEQAASPSGPAIPPQPPLAQRLALAAERAKAPARDGFTPAKDWVRLVSEGAPGQAAAPVPAEDFGVHHKLSM